MRSLIVALVRLVVGWVVQALALLITVLLLPEWSLHDDPGPLGPFWAALSITLVLAVLNLVVRPAIVRLTLRLNVLTIGFFSLLINAAILLLASWLMPEFTIGGIVWAIVGTLIMTAVMIVLTTLFLLDDDYSFFTGVVQWLSRRERAAGGEAAGRGLVMLEIDGLGYELAQHAIDGGYLPTVKRLLDAGSHRLSHYDCGLPSQTSACQAGIMWGDNSDIPAFRWYEKDTARLVSSSSFADAAEMNARLDSGRGLLRGGSGISNHMAGDATKTLFVMSAMSGVPPENKRAADRDFNRFFVNPYLFPRTFVQSLWDILVELAEGLRQRLLNVRPRVSRVRHFYPFVRAGTNVMMRNVGTFIVINDVIRGVPAVYVTYVGYDEVAHHAGPATADALETLRGLDRQFGRVLSAIETQAGREYDFFVLSDHGQSWGATFKQRYGQTLADLVSQLTGERGGVSEVNATESSAGHVGAFFKQVEDMGREAGGGLARGAVARTGAAVEKRLRRFEPVAEMEAPAMVCVSGNLANVYFDLHTDKLRLSELEAAYPGLVDGLVGHEGVGLVIGYDDESRAVVLGKGGRRHLVRGEVGGEDPLARYGDAELRAAQLRKLAEFPHAGDLIVISTLYDDGEVAAFEELVGNHGGLGGPQTDAFILHPADMEVPPTNDACDVFALLDARRGDRGGA